MLLALLVAGCASYESKLKGYMGKPIEWAIERNGLPSSTLELPSGNTIYEWRFRGDVVMRHYGKTSYASQATCITGFEADPDGTLISWYYRGDCG